MKNNQIYSIGADMIRKGSIHGAIREMMIDFQIDGYTPEQDPENEKDPEIQTEEQPE